MSVRSAQVSTSRWEVRGPADPLTARRLRLWVDDWVSDNLRVDDVRRADMALAVAEALANAAEHAYSDASEPGEMSVALVLDDADESLTVQISDDGTWVDPATKPNQAERGRGLMLMRAMADDVTFDGDSRGTTVRLRFRRCPRR